MAIGNFSTCLKQTLAHEGDWSDHPADPGGATMKGVTLGRYREYYPKATKDDLRNISDSDLQRIYRVDYWDKVAGDNLPFGVDNATFDYGVNSGPARGVKALQSALGVKVDGVPGGETITAARKADGKSTIQKICASRLSFVRGLSTFAVFGKGWSKRIASVEAKSVAMWLAATGLSPQQVSAALITEAAKAGKTARSQNAAGGAVAGGSAVGSSPVVTGDVNWIALVGLLAVALLIAGALVVKARQNKARSEAYADASMGG